MTDIDGGCGASDHSLLVRRAPQKLTMILKMDPSVMLSAPVQSHGALNHYARAGSKDGNSPCLATLSWSWSVIRVLIRYGMGKTPLSFPSRREV